jgi:hypothetical protein
LRFAEKANRLQLGAAEPEQLSDVVSGVAEKGGARIAERVAKEKVSQFLDPDSDVV